jgi:DNA-binding transcriptional ArsR family regulator
MESKLLVQRLKAMADPTRLRLLAICRHGECSVSELATVIGQSQPRTSQHLKQLCEARLVDRFRDGKRVFYRIRLRGESADTRRQLLDLIPATQADFEQDLARLRSIRGESVDEQEVNAGTELINRTVYRALLDLTVTAPIGDLLDIGCGRGSLLKLLAPRASRAVGVDIDTDARQLARAELMLAGIPGCSLRKGDMYRLPFANQEFDTIILDDVLADADEPVKALTEARRLLARAGRLIILSSVKAGSAKQITRSLAGWNAAAGLRLAPARLMPQANPAWMLAVATNAESGTEAA